MAINLTTKFQKATSDLLKVGSKTSMIVNDRWDWDGANAVKVYTLADPTIATYDPRQQKSRTHSRLSH